MWRLGDSMISFMGRRQCCALPCREESAWEACRGESLSFCLPCSLPLKPGRERAAEMYTYGLEGDSISVGRVCTREDCMRPAVRLWREEGGPLSWHVSLGVACEGLRGRRRERLLLHGLYASTLEALTAFWERRKRRRKFCHAGRKAGREEEERSGSCLYLSLMPRDAC